MTTHQVGSVLADRYELLDPLQGDATAERYRALDRRLHREVVVEVERDGSMSAPASTAVGVRTFAGAEDTGMHAVLDGGESAGHHFVVREVPRGSFDDTGVIHTGADTAVMALPPMEAAAAAPAPAPRPGAARGGRPFAAAWLVGLCAAVVAVALLAAWASGGSPSVPAEGGTSVVADTSPTPTRDQGVAVTTPTTEAPTTTVPDVVSDPEQTDRFPEGFPFEDGGPPGPAKKEPKPDKAEKAEAP